MLDILRFSLIAEVAKLIVDGKVSTITVQKDKGMLLKIVDKA